MKCCRRIRGNHEVLIDEDTFNRANGYSRAGYEHREQTNEFPLKRHVRCAACGNYLTGYEVKARHKFYYKCNLKGCRCNYSVVMLHRKYVELLERYSIPQELLPQVSEAMMEILTQINQDKSKQAHTLKQELTTIEKKITGVKYKYGMGNLEKDVYQETLSVLLVEKATVEENLNLAAEKLSNINHTLPRLLLIFCNIGDYWQRGDYVFRQKLQKIMFPEGVSFDKNTGDYRTFSANPIAELIACIVATYANGHTKSDCDFTHQSLDVEKT